MTLGIATDSRSWWARVRAASRRPATDTRTSTALFARFTFATFSLATYRSTETVVDRTVPTSAETPDTLIDAGASHVLRDDGLWPRGCSGDVVTRSGALVVQPGAEKPFRRRG